VLVFDLLTNNSDRFSGGNLVASPDLRFLYFLDNTMGFQVDPEGHAKCVAALSRVQRFSRGLYEALQGLDADSLRRELDREPNPPYTILTREEIDAVIARRSVALTYMDSMIDEYGPEQVLVYP
jgi:hypothetical protein